MQIISIFIYISFETTGYLVIKLKTQRVTLSIYGENVLKYSMDYIAYSPLVGYMEILAKSDCAEIKTRSWIGLVSTVAVYFIVFKIEILSTMWVSYRYFLLICSRNLSLWFIFILIRLDLNDTYAGWVYAVRRIT